jgi:hypothetical protein
MWLRGLRSRRRRCQVPSYGALDGGTRLGNPLENDGLESGKVGVMDSTHFSQFCSEMDLALAGNGLNPTV